MKRLFTFGCSHTNHGYPTWANILAEEFDKHFNFGLEGSGPFYLFNQISNLIKHKDKWNLSKDDYFVFLIPEENRHDVVVKHDVLNPNPVYEEQFITNTIHNDCEKWYTKKYKMEFSHLDGLIKTTLYVESIIRLLQSHGLNYKIMTALDGADLHPHWKYEKYIGNLRNLIGDYEPLQTIGRNFKEKEIHYYFLNDKGELEMDGHWIIPIHLEFVKSNFDFYKETNVDKYLDIHESITKTNVFRFEMKEQEMILNKNEYGARYHYSYWPGGGLFIGSQNKLLPT